jgi:hypothetical protein
MFLLFMSQLQPQGLHEFGLDQGMASKDPKYEQILICSSCHSSCHTWRWMGLVSNTTRIYGLSNWENQQKKPILNSHQKGHLVILDTLFCTHPTWLRWFFLLVLGWRFWLVILNHDYLTISQIEQFH